MKPTLKPKPVILLRGKYWSLNESGFITDSFGPFIVKSVEDWIYAHRGISSADIVILSRGRDSVYLVKRWHFSKHSVFRKAYYKIWWNDEAA